MMLCGDVCDVVWMVWVLLSVVDGGVRGGEGSGKVELLRMTQV